MVTAKVDFGMQIESYGSQISNGNPSILVVQDA
jgi:hypothetical protein